MSASNRPSRRHVLGMAPMLAAALSACGSAADDPATNWSMPLESAPHLRSFLQWPVHPDVYDRRSLARVQAAIAMIANHIADFEPVVMLAAAEHHPAARRLLSAAVELWDVPTDDLWCRDSGPTFVADGHGGPAIMDFHFNGWGNKQPHANDARIAARLAERLDLRLIDARVVGEQGGVEHDGAGTLLAHASSWVNPNRNRQSAAVIERRLLDALGGRHMIWAPGIIGADITDYHIDALARFVGPGHVLIQIGERIDGADPWSVAAHETLAILREATDAHGRPLRITTLPDPVRIRSRQADFVASYVNYYVCNGAVIAAQFGDERADARARASLSDLYPGREVIMLDIDAIGESGGGIHCATQQQPAFTI